MDRLETGLAVTRYRNHGKEQAERKTGKEVVALPKKERRLQDDVRDARPGDERLAFTLASEIGVRRGWVSPERSHVHDPAYPGAAGLGHDVRDSRDVDLGEALLALGRDGHRVDHRIDAVERTTERLRLAHVGTTKIHVRARAVELLLGTGAFADQRPHLVPAEEQPGDRVPPHESVRAGHGYAHRLTALVLRGRSSSTSPARVNTSARGQNREHESPADRVD